MVLPAESCWAGAKENLPINLFNINVKLHRCVKYLDGKNLVNFWSAINFAKF